MGYEFRVWNTVSNEFTYFGSPLLSLKKKEGYPLEFIRISPKNQKAMISGYGELELFCEPHEIYQGDIVEVLTRRVSLGSAWYQEVSQHDGNCIARCKIIFDGAKFALDWKTPFNEAILENKHREQACRTFCEYDLSNTDLWKKVGNIHQNPKLLEENHGKDKKENS